MNAEPVTLAEAILLAFAAQKLPLHTQLAVIAYAQARIIQQATINATQPL